MIIAELSGRYHRKRGFVVRLASEVATLDGIDQGDFISLASPGAGQHSDQVIALVAEVAESDSFSIQVSERVENSLDYSPKDEVEIHKESIPDAETVILGLPKEIKADGPLPPGLRNQFNGAIIKRFQKFTLDLDKTASYPSLSETMQVEIRDYYPEDAPVAISQDTNVIAGPTTPIISSDHLPTHTINKYIQDYTSNLERREESRDGVHTTEVEASEKEKRGVANEGNEQSSGGQSDERTEQSKPDQSGFDMIGGYNEAIRALREIVETPLENPELFAENGVDLPSGVLLHGPQGVGKTQLAEAICTDIDAHSETLSVSELVMELEPAQVDENISSVIQQARNESPAVVFIGDLEAIASDNPGSAEQYVIKQLKGVFDRIESDEAVIIIGATNNLDGLDDSFRRPSRFGREIGLQPPDIDDRREILTVLTRGMSIDDTVNFDTIASETQGYVGEDLKEVVNRASLSAVQRTSLNGSKPDLASSDNDITVTPEDFEDAIQEIDPTNLEGFSSDLPDVSWDDIGGLNDVKRQLRRVVEWPLKYPEKFDTFDIEPASGILLYGPPGTGKTMLAKALANQTDSHILTVDGPELMNKWIGSSEANVRDLFKQARQPSSTIILFDEIDALTPDRDSTNSSSGTIERVVAQMLTELDGLNPKGNVTVVATTNQPTAIDQAFLRPGRFDYQIHVPAPKEQTRLEIFRAHTAEKPLADDVALDELAALTQGYVGADIEAVCREAAMLALDESLEDANQSDSTDAQRDLIRPKHFREALDAVGPTADEATRIKYDRIEAEMNDSDTVSVDDVDTDGLPDFPSE